MVTSTPADASTQRELRMRAAVMAPRQTLPSKQRRLKGGTTSFMVVIHVLATVALLPRFWSWQGSGCLRRSVLDDRAWRHPGPASACGAPQL